MANSAPEAKQQNGPPETSVPLDTLTVLGLLVAMLFYCYWNSLAQLKYFWDDPRYSHGWLVPAFAAVLLWLRWDAKVMPRQAEVSSVARWWGMGLLAYGLLMRLVATRIGIESLDFWSMVFSLAGVVLLAGGWSLFIWAGPVIAFLVFMFPLPYRMEEWLLVPLQKVATRGAAYVLQTFGYGAYCEGNTIFLGDTQMDVVEACSGLRMLTVFSALTASVALALNRPIWERLVIFVSAVPIAVAANVLRISVTGLAFYHVGPWLGHMIHDNGEWVMMPPALAMLYLEILVLSKMFLDAPPAEKRVSAANPLGMAGRM
ncbi:MAG: exosortase/archaeosortase family protein [Planctomycetes bacterium]|nr:exosortase/archaeosortase family protein [Planctomycetota bacterium]